MAVGSLVMAVAAMVIPQGTVVSKPGTYCQKGSSICACLVNGEGESIEIRLKGTKFRPHGATDITAFAWIGPGRGIFSTASVYGSPAIYYFDERRRVTTELAHGRRRDRWYPAGRDWFKLIGIKGNVVEYWYCPNIETLDEGDLDRTATRRRLVLPGSIAVGP